MNEESSDSEVIQGVRIVGLLKAFIFTIFVFIPLFIVLMGLWFGSNGIVFYTISKAWDYLELKYDSLYQINEIILGIVKLLSYVIGFIFTLSIWWYVLRFIYLFNAKNIIDLKQYKNKTFKTTFNFKNPKKIIITYHIHNPQKNLEKAILHGPSDSLTSYIKSFYPEFEYMPKYKLGSTSHNLAQISEIIDLIEKNPSLVDKIPLGQESLRITITNLDNGEKNTISVESSLKMLWFEGLYWVSPKIYPEYYEGEHYELVVKYKGLKGYDFKLWVK